MEWTTQEYWEGLATDAMSGWWRRRRMSRAQRPLDKLVARAMRHVLHHRIKSAAERTDAYVWSLSTDSDKAISAEVKRILEAVEDGIRHKNYENTVLVKVAPLRIEILKSSPDIVTLREYAKQVKRLEKNKGLFVPGVRQLVSRHELNPLSLLDPRVAHILVAGSTGSGKTMLAVAMLTTLAMLNSPDQWSMLVIDPKKVDIGNTALAKLPHLSHGIITDPTLAVAAVNRLATELERRELEVEEYTKMGKRWNHPHGHIFCYIDELYELTDIDDQVMDTLTWIAKKGRGLGIHLCLATQRPTVDAVDGHLRANLTARFGGWVRGADESRIVTGLPGSGLETLQGSGMFKVFVRDLEVYLQGLLVDLDEHLPGLVEDICKQWGDKRPGFRIGSLRPTERAPESVLDAVADEVTNNWETEVLKQVIAGMRSGLDMKRRDIEKLRKGIDGKGVNQSKADQLRTQAQEYLQKEMV